MGGVLEEFFAGPGGIDLGVLEEGGGEGAADGGSGLGGGLEGGGDEAEAVGVAGEPGGAGGRRSEGVREGGLGGGLEGGPVEASGGGDGGALGEWAGAVVCAEGDDPCFGAEALVEECEEFCEYAVEA